jgi:SAM-dependent methyltransferase
MISTIELKRTRCAICQTESNATEVYPANFDPEDLNPVVFSARRLPDRVHYRMVRCDRCGLVRSDPVADAELLAHLYRQSTFDYGEEVTNLRRTYRRYLARLDRFGARHGALLEIGCGNGFFLEEALAHGYARVRGVEPSTAAISMARADVAPHIVCDVMRPGLFGPEQFDAVCMFQVFDHISEPGALLEDCLDVIKPGGLLLGLNHNVESASARLLGERSPIVDIEHTYLYSPNTMSRLLVDRGFEVLQAGAVFNSYTLNYLTRLLPLPAWMKRPLLATLRATRLGRACLRVPLGNLYVVARKPR